MTTNTSYSRSNPYAKIANFGNLNPALKTDAVAYSIYQDLGSYFQIGANASDFGPSSEKSQLFMSERCSKNWDGACELMSRNKQQALSNVGGVSSTLFSSKPSPDLTIGDVMIDNSAVRRFCNMDSCSITKESFNPLDSDSPMITKYGECSYENCQPVCMPPPDPDTDVILNKVLDFPDRHVDLLKNMYNNVIKSGKRANYKNTRIGMVFDIFDSYVKINPNGL